MSEEFEDYFGEIENLISKCTGGNEMYALKMAHKNYFRIKTGFYEDESPSEVSKEICMSVNESSEKIECPSCGWSWRKSQGGKDMFQCHKCGNTGGFLTESVVNESSILDSPVRKVVKDLVNFIKLEQTNQWYLPEDLGGDDMEYNFSKLPLFSVEMDLTFNDQIEGQYFLDGSFVDDEDVLEITLIVNTNSYPQSLYDIVADLNDIVAHELEHLLQDSGVRTYEFEKTNQKPQDKEYYKQSVEVPAEIQGFRRIVKLRKEKPEKVIRDWFIRNRQVHELSNEDIDELVNFLTSKYEEYYGSK